MLTDRKRKVLGTRMEFLRAEEERLRSELDRTVGEMNHAMDMLYNDFQERQCGKTGKSESGAR
jgi:hypothetical protein